MNPTAIDLEICPGLDSLVSQRAACGPSRRSIENSRKRKRLGRAIRKALAPITTQHRRFTATWTTWDEPNLCGDPIYLPHDLWEYLNLGPVVGEP